MHETPSDPFLFSSPAVTSLFCRNPSGHGNIPDLGRIGLQRCFRFRVARIHAVLPTVMRTCGLHREFSVHPRSLIYSHWILVPSSS